MAGAGFVAGLLGAMVQAGTPLLLASLGEIVSERAGVLNLGVEGMMLVGALTGFATTVWTGSPWLGVLVGAGAGAARLPDIGLPRFGPTHAGVLVAIAAVAVIRLLIARTEFGFEIVVTGSNPEAARQAGMNTGWIYMLVLALGGALAGVAGAVEIAGVQGKLQPAFSPGYGFTAIPIALLGRRGAGRVLLAALFFAVLIVGGSSMEITFGVPAALVEVIQALVILFLITAEFFKRYRVDLVRAEPGPGAGADPEVEA